MDNEVLVRENAPVRGRRVFAGVRDCQGSHKESSGLLAADAFGKVVVRFASLGRSPPASVRSEEPMVGWRGARLNEWP